MNILSQQENKFTNFLNQSINQGKIITRLCLIKALENKDREIAANRDINRFSIIRISQRTIITSIGKITFKRRYYYDNYNDSYIYLLDAFMSIPKYKRLSNELELKILNNLALLSYSKAAKHACDESYIVSPTTVANVLNRVDFSPKYKEFDKCNKIFIQIDEKYINLYNCRNKKPFFTATIFTSKLKLYATENYQRYELANRTILLSPSKDELYKKINSLLINNYKLSKDTEVIVSGDFARYIRNSKEKILAENIIYIPDFFHVQQYAKKLLGEKLSYDIINSLESVNNIINQLRMMHKAEKEDKYKRTKIYTLKSILLNYQNEMKYWFNDDYPGCSQEAINSHYASPRLAKLPMSISKESLKKMLILMEADANKIDLVVDLKNKESTISEIKDFSILDYKEKHYIDVTSYNHAFREVLTNIMRG
jgi:hypothetical protein